MIAQHILSYETAKFANEVNSHTHTHTYTLMHAQNRIQTYIKANTDIKHELAV